MSARARVVGALVESPLQLLCTIEAHAAGLGGDTTRVHVRDDVPTLAQVSHALCRADLPAGLTMDVRPVRNAMWSLNRNRIVGEAFSGVVQTALLTRPVASITLVDDGLAALDLDRILTSPTGAFVRSGVRSGAARRVLGRATAERLRSLARRGGLTLFTALPLPGDALGRLSEAGVRVVRDEFAWFASQPLEAAPAEPTVVVGSGLVGAGFVDADSYLSWVLSLAAEGPVLYVPYRRDEPLVQRVLRTTPGVTIADPGAMLELRLSGMHEGQRVLSLPTTSTVLLTSILGRRGVNVEVKAVPDSWWAPSVPEQVRKDAAFLVDLSAAARDAQTGARPPVM
ncbi:hypothetical protein [Myceligenerans salitolerans]|uniref:Uncharacterized protein n=1 Tax=Myceligenerans salitolerans TaxID=1230528 RepID=A0ABS3I4J2_9MICO|nr:hypothetical protein [Myceligenerans salitolerans]MBO0607916.1 hypothetical protein [Myceligenerans salitolerans]